MTATPAAPAPEITIRQVAELACRRARAALRSAASTTTAVPCWSSWKTGMSSRSCSRRSISKQRGAEMSSRLMPPKLGASRTTVSTISSTSVAVQADRDGVDAAELLEQHRLALHDRHRRGRPDVAEPEHRGAVGDDGDGVGHPGVVVGQLGSLGDRHADPGDAGRVGEGQVVAVAQWNRRRRSAILPPRCRSKTGSSAYGCGADRRSGLRLAIRCHL